MTSVQRMVLAVAVAAPAYVKPVFPPFVMCTTRCAVSPGTRLVILTRSPAFGLSFEMTRAAVAKVLPGFVVVAVNVAVVKAAAQAYGWDTRSSPKSTGAGAILTGRGIAYAFRNQTVVAEIAEVEVNRTTGHVWVKRLVCAYDVGLVINPEGLRHTIEGGMPGAWNE